MTGANERPRSSRRIFIELMVVEFWFPENANSEKNVVVCLPGQHLQAAVLGACPTSSAAELQVPCR